MIKLVVCDGDGTLQFPSPSKGTVDLLARMDALGIGLAVASNSPRKTIEDRFKAAGLAMPLVIVTSRDVGALKPSPMFIDRISSHTGIGLHEMVFLGDSDETDMFCAINAHVLPFSAQYSAKGNPKYGVPVTNPVEFALYLEAYGQQQPPFFGWQCVFPKQGVEVYALIGDHGSMGLTKLLKAFLKGKNDIYIGPKKNSLGRILFHYFMSQSYLSGLIQSANYVSVYPGHAKGSENPVLSQYSALLQNILATRYLPDLLLRHTDTAPSHMTSGANRNVYHQLSTVHLNPRYKSRIRNKKILVLDDFTTSGNSLDTARLMLLQGGATAVVGQALAKFRSGHNVTAVNGSWNPFAPFTLSPATVTTAELPGTLNPAADHYFASSIWKAANA